MRQFTSPRLLGNQAKPQHVRTLHPLTETTLMLDIRPPFVSSILQPPSRFFIFFRHPGYDDSNNVLFKLHASDTAPTCCRDGEPAQHRGPGLYAQFALDACAIVADNRTDGWLSSDRDPELARNNRVAAGSTLHARSYYFHLEDSEGSDLPYSIVPSFREWSFPHDRLPAHWAQLSSPSNTTSDATFTPSNLTAALTVRDGCCRITGHKEELQVAHLVPQAELDWWHANDMARYNNGQGYSLDDTANVMLLRADLHIAFDKPRFVFVPKPSDGCGIRLVFHLLGSSDEYEHYHHNRELHESKVSADLLFARFAWTLFPLLGAFLSCKKDRRLALRIAGHNQMLSRGFFSAADCEGFSQTASRKRSQSPKKRKPDGDVRGSAPINGAVVKAQANTPASSPNSRKRRNTSEENGKFPPDHLRGRAKRRKPSPCPALSPPSSSSISTPSSSRPPSFPAEPSSQPEHTEVPCTVASSLSAPAIPHLAQQWLDSERLRSDPEQTWMQDNTWVELVWAGKSLAGHEIKRWLELSGCEVRDSNAEEKDDGRGPCERNGTDQEGGEG